MATLYGENLGYEAAQQPKRFLAQVMALSEALEDWWVSDALSNPPHRSGLSLGLYQTRTDVDNKKETVHPSIRWLQRPGQSPAEDERTPLDRFKNMLKIDFLSLQLLVYRPVILHAFSKGPVSEEHREHALSYRITATFIQKCVDCTKLIIYIVHDTVTSEHSNRGLLYAPWFSLSYSKSQR